MIFSGVPKMSPEAKVVTSVEEFQQQQIFLELI